LYDVVALRQLVPHRKAEQMQDLFSARVGTLTLLGIEWQLPDFLTLHGEAQLTLNEGLNQQFLPPRTTYYLNGHNFIEHQLRRRKIGFVGSPIVTTTDGHSNPVRLWFLCHLC
jgi:hypothetical protein